MNVSSGWSCIQLSFWRGRCQCLQVAQGNLALLSMNRHPRSAKTPKGLRRAGGATGAEYSDPEISLGPLQTPMGRAYSGMQQVKGGNHVVWIAEDERSTPI